jgi:restriction system protein
MALWMIRAGPHGEDENSSLDNDLVIIGWREVPDLSEIDSKQNLRELLETLYPNAPDAKISNSLGQLWIFRGRIETGDLVVLPLKTRSAIAVGRILGPYAYVQDRHVRKVEWLRTDIPRTDFGQDLLYSFGAFMTVCKIERNNAEARVNSMPAGGRDPYLIGEFAPTEKEDDLEEVEATVPVDLEEHATDQIRRIIETRFKGHDLTRLVSAVLQTLGYFTHRSPHGPDGGIDIIAGRGEMGFDSPRLCVQVKSGGPVDDTAVRELEGVMGRMKAEQGLFVSWGGFKSSVSKKEAELFFKVRLWDSDDLIKALLDNYDKLPENIQAELPLKRIWVPVLEE